MEKDLELRQAFPPVTTEAWEQAIRKDLRGADYEKTLLWKTPEGLTVKPYYRAEDLAQLEYQDLAPGEFPYTRGTLAEKSWRIREEIDEESSRKANQRARAAIAAGAEEIAFRTATADQAALDTLLKGLAIPIHFQNANENLLALLLAAGRSVAGSANFDPFRNLDAAAKFARQAPPEFRPLTIDGARFEEQGATTVQELGYTLAAGIDLLAELADRGVAIDRAAGAVVFSLAIGANYFFQIAKLRAFRLLWSRAVTSFGGSPASARAVIHCRTSRWNKTIYDAHVNVLRGTTEVMSAAIGGADSLAVAPFDATLRCDHRSGGGQPPPGAEHAVDPET